MKTEEKKDNARVRKGGKHGEITQKMMSFRIDNDLLDYLGRWANKGRLINELLRCAKRGKFGREWQDPDEAPDDIHDYEP